MNESTAPERHRGTNPVPETHRRLVVVGFGMVAYKLVERLAALDALTYYEVTVIGEEPYPAYDRAHLTGWLKHRNRRRLTLGGPDWSRDMGIRAVTGTLVSTIDRDAKTVRTGDGERIPYDLLVLATGSSVFVPPIEGADADGVFPYRTIDDLVRIVQRAARARRAIVVGGGVLGIEVADALRRLGLGVLMLEAGPCLMRRQLDWNAAGLLEARLHELGISIVAGTRARGIETRDDGQLVLILDGDRAPLAADMIVMASGVRPRDDLARDCGLAVASGRGGIVVNDELRTTDPAIHAIGECASHDGVVYGLVAPGFRMAEVLANILAGGESRFRGHTPAVRLRLPGIDVWSLGDHSQPGTHGAWRDEGSYRQIAMWGRRLVAAAAVGPWDELGFAQDAIRQRRRILPDQTQRFVQTGRFADAAVRRPVAEWPASAMVCNCLEITRGALSAAVAECGSSVEALAKSTGASTVCGFCRPLVAELVTGARPPAMSRETASLLTAAAAAVLLALAIMGGTPLPIPVSVQAGHVWDILYREGWWRQATGFTLLGCVLAAAVFSLRKRWRRVNWGDLGWWRVGHTALGALALAVLLGHTGLRLGSGFNQVLMIFFLSATVLGGATAAGLGRRYARLTFWLHVLIVWPLPVLIAFHVLATYYF